LIFNNNYKNHFEEYNKLYYVKEKISPNIYKFIDVKNILNLIYDIYKNNNNISILNYNNYLDFNENKLFTENGKKYFKTIFDKLIIDEKTKYENIKVEINDIIL